MKSLGLALVVMSVAVLVGCSGGSTTTTAPVTGTVTLDGEPISGGYVQFFLKDNPDDLPGASGIIQRDGTYAMNSGEAGVGAVLGTHRVQVQPPEQQSFGDAEQTEVDIPVKYQEADSSGLEVTVPEEGTTFDIELSSS